jgi:hypothetical protein
MSEGVRRPPVNVTKAIDALYGGARPYIHESEPPAPPPRPTLPPPRIVIERYATPSSEGGDIGRVPLPPHGPRYPQYLAPPRTVLPRVDVLPLPATARGKNPPTARSEGAQAGVTELKAPKHGCWSATADRLGGGSVATLVTLGAWGSFGLFVLGTVMLALHTKHDSASPSATPAT